MHFTPVKAGSLEYFRADNISVPHCFTTRLGGVSTGIFDSLNLSISQGDDPACVTENYRRIGALLYHLLLKSLKSCHF
jgi:copper oxidase (laccase) domain-containing protein